MALGERCASPICSDVCVQLQRCVCVQLQRCVCAVAAAMCVCVQSQRCVCAVLRGAAADADSLCKRHHRSVRANSIATKMFESV